MSKNYLVTAEPECSWYLNKLRLTSQLSYTFIFPLPSGSMSQHSDQTRLILNYQVLLRLTLSVNDKIGSC